MSTPRDAPLRRGERRQVSVMFCDIVGSSLLAERLEEEWPDLVLAFQDTCAEVVTRFGGFLKERKGDALVVYFGYPLAHEDDAKRAVTAGLGIIDALPRHGRLRDIGLQVRIGIHTGTIIVIDDDWEQATGSTLHIASRLQEFAEVGTVAISGATHDLVRGHFRFEAHGTPTLKNINAIDVYSVVCALKQSELVAGGDANLTPFVGRDAEVRALLAAWERTTAGECQVAEVSGEAGIGKSRLVRAVATGVNAIVFRCSEIDSSSALFPVVSRLEQLLGFDQLEDAAAKLDRLAAKVEALGFVADDVVPLLATELNLPLTARYRPSTLPTLKKRQQTLAILVDWIIREAALQPLMAIWEDLHWADASTKELLGLIIDEATRRNAPLLIVVTFRPEFEPSWPAFPTLTTLRLDPLTPASVEQMLSHIAGGRLLPREIVEEIVAKSDGKPLFAEELLRTVLGSGAAREEGDRYVIDRAALPKETPAPLKGYLTSRLDRLGPAKEIAQRAAVLGRSFSQDLLRAVIEEDAATEQERATRWQSTQQYLWQLVGAGMLRRRGDRQITYEFSHALMQDEAYYSLWKRSSYHLQTARVLERFSRTAETQPELIAHHYTEGGDFDRAVGYWQSAGERARDRSANREAIGHFAAGLRALSALPESDDRTRRELMLRVASITPIIAVEGYVADAAARTARRALEICRTLGDVDRLFPVLYVLWVNRFVAGDYPEALRLSEEFAAEASERADASAVLMSERLRGFSRFMMGELVPAEEHLRHALSLYDPRAHGELKNRGYGQDPRCACEAFMALVRWLRGYPDEAAEWSRQALAHAHEARHSNTYGYALCWGGATYEALRGDVASAHRHTSELYAFAVREGLPVWIAYGRVLQGWTLVRSGHELEGLTDMHAGLEHFEDVTVSASPPDWLHMGFMKSLLLYLLADACRHSGRAEEALGHVERALSFALKSGEVFWAPELFRLKGELLLDCAGSEREGSAESCFLEAIARARHEGALSLELRAALSLARIPGGSAPSKGREILEQAYNRFTEGFDAPELVAAREQLHRSNP